VKLSEQPKVLAMPGPSAGRRKVVKAIQGVIDALPAGSGDWSVLGVPGLYARAGRNGVSYRLMRRIKGKYAVRALGPMALAEARRMAMTQWAALKPAPPDGRATLAQAWESYLAERTLADKSRVLYAYNLARYLAPWADRSLAQIAEDRAGFRAAILTLARRSGVGTASQVLRQFRAVYNYRRLVDLTLPENPAAVVKLPALKARNWALSDDELRQWWTAVNKLSPVKRAWWLTALFTGARRDSLRLLRWRNVDLDRAVIRFEIAKGGRAYAVPAAARLVDLLRRWHEECPPTDEGWVFPSPRRAGEPLFQHIRNEGVRSPHSLRHSMRTRLAEAGATPDLAKIALGHSMTGDVSRGYITPSLLVEAVRPLFEAVAQKYAEALEWPA
jgi:integrase